MQFFRVLFGLAAVLVAGFFAYEWYLGYQASNKAYSFAEQRIENAIKKDTARSLDFSDLANLRALPDEIVLLDELSDLRLSNTNIRDLTPIASLPRLTALHLKNTRITDLSPLVKSPNLKSIYLGHSWVFDLEPLVSINTLTNVVLGNTAIKSLEPITRMESIRSVNLYSSYAHDGSQNHYEALRAKSVGISSGKAYRQNYAPGPPYRLKIFLSRVASRFAGKYPSARKAVVYLRGARKGNSEDGNICVANNTGATLYFTYAEDIRKLHPDLPHNGWFCVDSTNDGKLKVSREKYGPEICKLSTRPGEAYTITEYGRVNGCKWK